MVKAKRCPDCNSVLSGKHVCGEMKIQSRKRTKVPTVLVKTNRYSNHIVETDIRKAKALAKSFKPDLEDIDTSSDNYISLTKRGTQQRKGLRDVASISINTENGIKYDIDIATIDGGDVLYIRKNGKGAQHRITITPQTSNTIILA